jgi:hypothetical protein
MNHYGKLAVTAFRLIAVLFLFWALLGVISGVIFLGQEPSPPSSAQGNLMISFVWLVGAVILYALSGRLGTEITRGLDD